MNNWLDDLKAAAERGLESDDLDELSADMAKAALDTFEDQATSEQLANIRRESKVRNHGRRASDSEIARAILTHEPALARAHFRKAIRRLEVYFETALDATGAQAGRDVIEKIHVITGKRRRK